MDDDFLTVGRPNVASEIVLKEYEDFEKAHASSGGGVKYCWKTAKKTGKKGKDGKKQTLTEQNTYLGFLSQGVLHSFMIPRDFPTLDEYLQAENEGFRQYKYREWLELKKFGFDRCNDFDSIRGEYELEEWKAIAALGYETANEYDKVRGSFSIEEWAQIVKLGYKDHSAFEKDKGGLSPNVWIRLKKMGLRDSVEFGKAEKMGFASVSIDSSTYYDKKEYEDAFGWGHRHKDDKAGKWLEDIDSVNLEGYLRAKRGGFKNRSEFESAKEDEFDDAKEWYEFKESEFKTRQEFLRAKELGFSNPDAMSLYVFLSSFEEGIPIAIHKIEEATGFDEDDLQELCEDAKLKELGTLVQAAGYFITEGKTKTGRIKTKASNFEYAVVDGSNVAYANNQEEPRIANIVRVKEELEERGLKPIIFVSASLRHKIDDPEKLEERIRNNEIIQTPAGGDNDSIIIESALERDGLIISNDQFGDWMEANPEEAARIKKRRVGVVFVEEDVHFDKKLSKLRSGTKKRKG